VRKGTSAALQISIKKPRDYTKDKKT